MDAFILALTRDIEGLGRQGDRLALRPGHADTPAAILHPVAANYGRFAGLIGDGLTPLDPLDAREVQERLRELGKPDPSGPRPRLRLCA